MPDLPEKLLAISFSLMILGQAVLVRRIVGTWLFPACIFGLLWFGFTFIPLVALFAVPINPFSIAYLLICCLSVSTCGLLFDWNAAFRRNSSIRTSGYRAYENAFIRTTFYVTSVLAIICVGLNLLEQGFQIGTVVADIVGSSSLYATMRGAGEIHANIFGQASLGFAYIGAAIGGLLIADAHPGWQRRIIVVLSLLPSIVIMLTESAKGALYLSIGLFYGGVLVNRIESAHMMVFSKKAIRPIFTYGTVILPLVAISFLARGLYGSTDLNEISDRLASNFASYLFGSLYAFSDWFSFSIGTPSRFAYFDPGNTYGFYTFAAVFKLFGSSRSLPAGVYEEVFAYGDFLATNIYTLFRSLITDFGLFGSIVFCGITSFAFHLSFRTILFKSRPVLGPSIFIFMMGYFWHSYLASMFMYNNIYFCFALLWLILFVNSRRRSAISETTRIAERHDCPKRSNVAGV